MLYLTSLKVKTLTKKERQEFNTLVSDIVNNPSFRELDNEVHHGISRFGHSYRVAQSVFVMTKKLHFRYEEATRAALLHDFYFNYQLEENGDVKNLVEHPSVALLNANKYYELTPRQENMISSHMFPMCKTLPKYKESFCLTIIDKIVAIYEQQRYKMAMKLGVYLLFAFNMITLQK